MGVVQALAPALLKNKDKNIQNLTLQTYSYIIKSGIQGLKDRELHPYRQTLTKNGIVSKLIQILKDRNKDKSDNSEIIESLACLFKSLLLPSEIKNDVINELKLKDKYDFLALLAECQDNHDAIMANDLEYQLFQFENKQKTIPSLRLTLQLLRFGEESKKRKIALAVKWDMEILTDNKYLDKREGKLYSTDVEKEQIKAKAQEGLAMIKAIIGDDEKTNEFETEKKKCFIQ
ncbi:MAG: hypothetical protein EZS28_011709 [Streblomastix strix]|uniref:Uncharacterized protein n=1 Tax=Streblomastix strix TaxID=222440 RepID=A0A5J4WE18_9EUKA|nr:MAG: hypothetical protein EZS28_011709 [Streblomastix strix]